MGMTSQQCRATKRDGTRCRRDAIRGGEVCRSHGGTLPVVRRKAEERVALWEAMQLAPGRHPGEVLLDVVRTFDALMKDARQIVIESESPTPLEISTLVERLEKAGRFAKVALDANAQAMLNRQATMEAEDIAGVINRAMGEARLCEACEVRMRGALRGELERMADDERTAAASSPANRPSRMDASIVINGTLADE